MTLKEQIQAEANVYGTWLRIPHPNLVEILGRSGFDFLHIDMEHGPIGMHELDSMLLAAKATGIPAMVRVPQVEESIIGKALDLGATGVVVPRVNNAHDALEAVNAAFFAPLGQRGLGGACRANDFGKSSFQQFAEEANRQTVLALQIETKEAVERIDEILEVSADATDVYFIGPADLSQSLGVPGQFDNPLLIETIQWVTKRIQKRGKKVGIHLPNPALAPRFAELGIHYFTSSFDLGIVSEGAKLMLQKLKQQPQSRDTIQY
ncbi:HpcH/HpaI aldolase family protein [Tumebacillus flagellatus]|uniref:HpcH/HpaI aldolase/citrate lyase domain-containing protein n=1 Tax=Tumebacillus flagellatus TaxID=1157490 RepID=A0A074LIG0_9BACL|nr:aldolase/citrate lyase family protein [Tumebacillus flagellatus]KEO81996.1 hypothetical protein EL26_17645 [Tumebacillus flagellatus]